MDSSEIQSIELKGHSQQVYSVAFSPSDQLIASGSYDKTVRLWSAQSGDQLAVLNGHTGKVTSVAFSPDGAIVASGSWDNTIKLWRVTTKLEITTLNGNSWVLSVAFSPDGVHLAVGCGDQTIRLWDVESRACIKTMKGHEVEVLCVAFSPDSKTIASGSWDTIRLWQVESGTCLATLKHHQRDVISVAFSPAGDILASGSQDNTGILWDTATNTPIATLQDHTDWVTSVAISPNGKFLASSSRDNTVQLWDIASRSCSATLEGHSDGVWSVAFSVDGSQLASGSQDNTIRVWRLPDQFLTETTKSSLPQDDPTPLPPHPLLLDNDVTSLISPAGAVLIGFGGSGDVFSATHQDRGKVALKRTQKGLDQISARRFLREIGLWRSVSHPNVLPCLGMCQFDAVIYVVSPFIENGDVSSCISKGVPFNRVKILYEVAEALTHLHHRGIIHGDVKAQNVLLSNDRSALLCDFGLAKVLDSMVTSTENKGAGSVRWMAPELLEDAPRSMASDVYSFAITIAEVLSGQAPYSNILNNIAVLMHVHSGGRPPKVPVESDEGRSYSVLWDTAEKCWAGEAKDRPYMVQALALLFPLAGERN